MSPRHPMPCLSVDELLERAASIANLAMLRTYAEPSPVQIAVIDDYASLLEYKLVSLSLGNASTRKKIQDQLAIHRSILAPIRRLPVELLCDIFLLVLEEYPLRTLQAAIIVSHVCVTWRSVARNHGALWTKAVVETLDEFDDYRERFLPMTKQVPLELRCDNHKIIWDLWDRMAPYASRWRRITLAACLGTLRELKVLYTERLERLVLFACDEPIFPDLSVLDIVVAPRLRHIALTLEELQSARQLHIPVTRTLTSLAIETMHPFPVTHTLPLLQACADTLQSLTLKVRYPLDGPEGSYLTSTSHPFVMKALTYLSLVDPACALLNHVTAPLTQSLILSNVPTYGTQSLQGFLTRSQASRTLIEFRVYIPAERDPSAWIPCLQLMDGLIDLHFDDMLSNEEFLKRMVIRPNERPLVPSLGWINIARIFREHIELQDVLLDVGRSRGRKVPLPDGRIGWQTLGWFKDH